MIFVSKIYRRFLIFLSSVYFRLRYKLPRGTLRIDAASIARSALGFNSTVRGVLSVNNSALIAGNYLDVADYASLGADKNGVIEIGNSVYFGPRTVIGTSGAILKIGSRTSFFSDCLISGAVTIGSDCLFAKNVTVLSSTHQICGADTIRENDANYKREIGYHLYDPVSIGNDCWLGSNVVVLPGVSLGNGTVVGANSVVTNSFPDYAIVGGVPAKVIGSRLS